MDIDFFTVDNGVFSELLGKSDLDVVVHASCESPAIVYNEFIRFSDAQYLCFCHADVTTSGLMEAIERTIKAHSDFGALGAVGSNKGTIWGRKGNIQEVITVDSCCIVINTEHGLYFDEKTFDSYHLYVESMCMQTRALGLKNYTLDLNAYEYREGLNPEAPYFCHHSHTWHQLGANWGDYNKYRKLLSYKWPDVETT
ncbi:MAG: hypothetical protein WC390_12575 [Sulfurimonas sp.]|jgi:hypothetical protein